MTPKQLLIEQFTIAYDQNGWFVALKNTLANLTAEQAAWKPENVDNSIWEILAHLNYYNYGYLERFKGVDYVYPKANNDETFASAEDISEKLWRAEIDKFDAIMTKWRNLLESADDEKFNQTMTPTRTDLWDSLMSHVNLHNAHHAGQIVVLRKLQGSWDASKGVS